MLPGPDFSIITTYQHGAVKVHGAELTYLSVYTTIRLTGFLQ